MRQEIGRHWKTMMETSGEAVTRSHMILCGLSVGLPLFAGYFTGHLSLAIYGALVAYLLTFAELRGPLAHRLFVLSLTFFLLIAGFAAGLALQGEPTLFLLALAPLAYWIGLWGGEGAEFERAALFSALQVVVVSHTPALTAAHAMPLLQFALIGFVLAVAGTISQSVLAPPTPRAAGFLEALRQPLASKRDRHLHALSYTATALFTAWLVSFYDLERGYWAILAVLLVMKPNRTLSVYRSFQQLLGTVLAVLVAEALIYTLHTPVPLLALITLASASVPWALKRNYWLVAFLATVIILLMLDLPLVATGDLHTPILRLRATGLGCLLGITGALLSWLLCRITPRSG